MRGAGVCLNVAPPLRPAWLLACCVLRHGKCLGETHSRQRLGALCALLPTQGCLGCVAVWAPMRRHPRTRVSEGVAQGPWPAQGAHVGTCQLAARLMPALPVHTQLAGKQPWWLSQTVHLSPVGLQGTSKLVAQHPGCRLRSAVRAVFLEYIACQLPWSMSVCMQCSLRSSSAGMGACALVRWSAIVSSVTDAPHF